MQQQQQLEQRTPLTSAIDGVSEHSILAEVRALLELSVGPASGAPLHALGGKQTLDTPVERATEGQAPTGHVVAQLIR